MIMLDLVTYFMFLFPALNTHGTFSHLPPLLADAYFTELCQKMCFVLKLTMIPGQQGKEHHMGRGQSSSACSPWPMREETSCFITFKNKFIDQVMTVKILLWDLQIWESAAVENMSFIFNFYWPSQVAYQLFWWCGSSRWQFQGSGRPQEWSHWWTGGGCSRCQLWTFQICCATWFWIETFEL